ncbi:hypothetical protein BH23ACT10_BH23ACT10_39980 [soil metagenome]
MSLRWNARVLRAVLAVLCAVAVMMVSALPATAKEGKAGKNDKRRYTVDRGPCRVDDLPKGASQQWTPGGESIVHRVRYGQGLQDIAWSYGFKGDNAFKRLWDANPQLDRPYLERAGITIRIPTCGSELRRRKLPKPPPPPEPTESETPAPSTDESTPDAPESDPAPAPAPKPEQAATVPSGSVWDKLAQCESGGNWAINTGNGYYGGLQFSASSWAAVGGSGLPHQHSRAEQIKRGERLRASQGWGAWPACSAKLGLR